MDFRTDQAETTAPPAPRSGRASQTRRRSRGKLACLSGAMAEETVARCLEQRGLEVIARRWRSPSGEIDLICRDGDCVVFVEVKQAATYADAAIRLSRPQMDRICAAANDYCGSLPAGLLTEMRFDVALVDGTGRVDILHNAFGEG